MSDQPTDSGATPQDGAQQPPAQPKMQVLGQFIRDLSFENIVAQKGVNGEVSPDVQVQVNLDAKKRNVENQYEVVTKFKVESRNKDEAKSPLFLMELEYGGIFLIENVPDEQLHPFLLIECPRMLFPFVRRIVSDMTRDGGFPPLNLDTVDFVALYRQELIRRAQAEQAAKAKPDA
ncbi:protein-export chaperone SecB [Aliiruegeria lutimaris]|uniref:Protein-export protein SecB n=1 Tax=Aliiruegeria lutimaris TaxID=571298 RepID=A0A1G8NBC9_9RHOB|nr:protein-export chaperone SecB [Aliiruegeria lutimaris]SDI77443.1 protein translocase subunit secB [Aliiruegeria lutimaris]